MHAHCIVAILALITIPLSFALVSVDAPLNAADCQPVSLTWEGGIEPWLLRILSASSPNPVISDLASSTGPQFTWIVDIEPGTSVILQVLDSTGDTGVSTPFTIQPGTSLNGHCPVGASSGGGGLGQGGGQVSSGGTLPSGTNSSSGGESGGTSAGGGGTSDSSGSSTGDTGGADGTTSASTGDSGTSNDTPTVSRQPGDSLADASSVAAKPVSPSGNSLLNGNSASSDPSVSTSTTSSVTSTPSTETQVSKSVSASNSALGSSTFDLTPGSPTSSPPGPLGGGAGQTLPATTAISSETSSMGTGESDVGSSSFSKKNVMTGSIIGGIIAGVLCALLAAFCVVRRCRRRRLDEPGSLVYPFSAASDSEAAVPREMVGRSGYPASTFSSWGNHGDLADERAFSPTSPVAGTEDPPWQPGQGTIESRYVAAFTPGHTASSSSIDRNDPTTQRRFRGPIPKNMIDALHARPADAPSSAILGEQSNGGHATDGSSAHVSDEIQPQEMTSWGRVHDMMDGRHPVIVGYPPPYTSR